MLYLDGMVIFNALKTHRVYTAPSISKWKIPLLTSLLEFRNQQWEVTFDEIEEKLEPTEIQCMIDDICTSK